MIKAAEELHQDKLKYAENSYEWLLIHERYNKKMNIEHNKMRMNFACNFIHNYRILCKLHATNPQEAFKQAKKLESEMSFRERRALHKTIKSQGVENFNNILLKEFQSHAKEIDIEKPLRTNELVYDVNKEFLEYSKGENIKLLKKGKVVDEVNYSVGDLVRMSTQAKTFIGKKVKLPPLDYKIIKATKNMHTDSVILYNEKYHMRYEIPIKEFIHHVRKMEKMQNKQTSKENKKQYKTAEYKGTFMGGR